MAKITSSIAGLWNFKDAKEIMKAMVPGRAYEFKAEPENPYDPNAIALYVVGAMFNAKGEQQGELIRCGYIPKVLAEKLSASNIESITKGEKYDQIIITTKEPDNAPE